jgi:hypothetical protein
MKNFLLTTSFVLVIFSFLTSSFTTNHKLNITEVSSDKISLKLKGTGSKHITVKVGIGSAVGKCERGCYKTIGPNTTVSIQANVGDVIWDADRKTTILKVSSGMNGSVIDLKGCY